MLSPFLFLHSSKHHNKPRGFTLLEILLVVAIIAILAGIVIVAINPARQLGQSRDAQRKSDINTIYKGLNQYLIDNGAYPSSVTSKTSDTLYTICDTTGGSCSNGTTYVDLSTLVPTYIPAVPKDPQAAVEAGYQIAKVSSGVYVQAPDTEIGYTQQAGYSSTTNMIAFIGKVPDSYEPPGPTGGGGSIGGGTPAETNYALQFSGSDYVEIPYTSAFYPNAGTVELWYKGGVTGTYNLISPQPNAAYSPTLYLQDDVISGGCNVYSSQISSSATDVNDGEWHHIALTWTGSSQIIWLDGVNVASGSSIPPSDDGRVFRFGSSWVSPAPTNGMIDEVRISNVARTYSGVPSHTLGSDGNTVAYWKFNEGSGTDAADETSNNHDGTISASDLWVENTW